MQPAHKLEPTEVILGGAVELTVQPRLSAQATVGLGVGDLSLHAGYASNLLIGSTVFGGTFRAYLPIDWALSVQLERSNVVDVLAGQQQVDSGLISYYQGMLKMLSIPTQDQMFYGGLNTTALIPSPSLDALDGAVLFVGGTLGVNVPLNDFMHVQFEFNARPFLFLLYEGQAQSQALFATPEGRALGMFFGLFQINAGLYLSVYNPRVALPSFSDEAKK